MLANHWRANDAAMLNCGKAVLGQAARTYVEGLIDLGVQYL
jgi:hypothetical protein